MAIKIKYANKIGKEFSILVNQKKKKNESMDPIYRIFPLLEDDIRGIPALAKYKGKLMELSAPLADQGEIELLTTGHPDGYRVYMRSLSLVFILALRRLYPDWKVSVQHSISSGLYCLLKCGAKRTIVDTRSRDKIKLEMKKIIEEDLEIKRLDLPYKEALDFFEREGRLEKLELLKQNPTDKVSLYDLAGYRDSFYGYLLPRSSMLRIFDLEIFDRGLVILGPDPDGSLRVNNFKPTYLLSDSYNEAERWSDLQGISYLADLNRMIEQDKIAEVCRMTEILQDYKIMQLARDIYNDDKRVVLIAAPSSSGKSSFAYKLTTHLRVLGLRPLTLNLDDYFLDRDKTPLAEDGSPDYEALEAIDIEKIESDVMDLIRGKKVRRVRFNFIEGKSYLSDEYMSLSDNNPIIIEGIHGLNPALCPDIPDNYKFRIALSVIAQINMDRHNRIATTDLRLLRRMARDKQFRGKSSAETIMEWPKVRRGEEKNIFPYTEEADAMFNSSYVYEIAALKPMLEDDLKAIDMGHPAYSEAVRLLSLLKYFRPMTNYEDIPNTSILREFIGGSRII